MTNPQPGNDLGNRINTLKALMMSAGRVLTQASEVAQRNASNIKALTQDVRRNAGDIQALTQYMSTLTIQMSTLTQRVDSLTAASERHDRILDYLLRREAGDIDVE